jgi:acyl carrier protein
MADDDPPALAAVLRLPRSDRRSALEALVGGEFKRALLMSERDELPLDENYFDLGLTSLRASEIKQRLEAELQCELDTSVLFSSSTVRQIVDHVAAAVLPDGEPAAVPGLAAEASERRRLVGDLLRDLYES